MELENPLQDLNSLKTYVFIGLFEITFINERDYIIAFLRPPLAKAPGPREILMPNNPSNDVFDGWPCFLYYRAHTLMDWKVGAELFEERVEVVALKSLKHDLKAKKRSIQKPGARILLREGQFGPVEQ
ncbi:hypothetical protein T069G_07650 [Trichoderma breve]|uniref:Uncharacterized protein n=1 Tax=Trichoderma breve TaxID=2034170 RepID=A0A9W9E542_9HYPO|nr:hypothetical protein T069G_07650 [Trichoderma breve]KAJ4859383.1 hypothetical protein T069G_07650 [Trichoderma breve]